MNCTFSQHHYITVWCALSFGTNSLVHISSNNQMQHLGCQYPVELLQPRGLQQVPGQLPLRHAHRWLLLHPRPADGEADEQVLRERLQLHPH